LDFDGAVHRIDDAAEFNDAAVAGAFDDAPVVGGDCRIREIAAETAQARECAILVRASESAVTDDYPGPGSPRAFGFRSLRLSGCWQISTNASPSAPKGGELLMPKQTKWIDPFAFKRKTPPQPKSASSRFAPVQRADLEGRLRVVLRRSSSGRRITAICANRRLEST
jgi:hypothetical protein